ncbi:MAG: peptidylprolyl isomerase [Sandaracinaceae bacterium]
MTQPADEEPTKPGPSADEPGPGPAEEGSLPVGDECVATLALRVLDDDGTLLEEATEAEPLAYLHGHGNLVPGLESALAGRTAGDELRVTLAPADAFGEARDDDGRALPRDAFPEDLELEEGFEFAVQADDGELVPMWVERVEGAQVFARLTHPLAGLTLHVEAKVLAVRPATGSELDHGHVSARARPHAPADADAAAAAPAAEDELQQPNRSAAEDAL